MRRKLIIGLCILAAVLAAALAIGAVILLRFIMLTRKQKKAISIANEHNELKTEFIQNISSQMEPTLDTLDPKLPGVQALRAFSGHIQELSELENSLSEPYEVQEKNISTFCESVMDKVRGKVQEDVTLTVNAPKLNVKINPEHLERILLHLLENAAEYTPAGGKIWLDFKKRGAHTHPRRATGRHIQTLYRSKRPDKGRWLGIAHLFIDCRQNEWQPDTGRQLHKRGTVCIGATRLGS